jgi:hypothetical protein
MTSQLPRKRRTTAARTTRLPTAAKLAAAVLLFGGPAAAQQPGQLPAQFGRNPTGLAAPAGRPAPTVGNPPPGYSAPRTSAAADAVRGVPIPDRLTPPSAGRVLYFHKPADASVPTPNPDTGSDGVAPAAGTADLPPTAPVSTPRDLQLAAARPIEPTDPGYVPPPLPAVPPPGYPTLTRTPNLPPVQSTSQKPRQDLPKPSKDDPKKREEMTRLMPRQTIFRLVDDAELERIVVKMVNDDIERMRKEQMQKPEKPGEAKPPPLPAYTDPETQRFPDLTDIRNKLAPPGIPYVPKTASYPPGKAIYEPNFVIHRRLHFEEKNAERYGWDFGFVQPLVSTLYFYKDTLLWPNSLGSGAVTGFWDASAGKCLPGSATPYLLYPPGLTSTGMLFEGGIITGTAFILAPVGAAGTGAAAAAGR